MTDRTFRKGENMDEQDKYTEDDRINNMEQDLIPYQKEEIYTPNFIICQQQTSLVEVNNQVSPINFINSNVNIDNIDLEKHDSFDQQQTAKPRFTFMRVASIVAMIVLGGLSIGAGFGGGYAFINGIIASNNQSIESFLTQGDQAQGEQLLATQVATSPEPMSMVAAVERVRPTVVSINTVVPVTSRQSGFFFSPFFDLPDEERPSSGTGIIFYEDDTNIYILTNEHVISDATSIEISFGQNRNAIATVKGRDVGSDLAVLYVSWESLLDIGITQVVTAEFGDSNAMQVGEFVMAIGNALGQGIITTQGVLSAQNIELMIDGRVLSVIQTDAAINPGNSGGPLINSRGQVVGINTVKISRPAVYGMGFAVTSNVAIPIIDGIMHETARPVLGILGSDVTEASQRYRYIPGVDQGVYINSVQRNSAAYIAGLEVSDVITHFDYNVVRDMTGLRQFISEQSLGDSIVLIIVRNGEPMELHVTFVQF